jgi:hypothetical protein
MWHYGGRFIRYRQPMTRSSSAKEEQGQPIGSRRASLLRIMPAKTLILVTPLARRAEADQAIE